jgi:CAP-Gly domain-containing linker protein 1
MQTPRQPRQSLIPTPGRPGHSNLPTPTASNSSRRARMSLGLSSRTEAEERDAAFHEAMRKMPPSSLLRASTIGLTRDETPERQLDEGISPLSYSTPPSVQENGSTIPTSAASSRRYANLGISQTGTPASSRLAPNQPRTPSGMQLRPRVPSSRVAQATTTPSRIVSGSIRPSTYQALGYPSSAVTPKRRVSNIGATSARTPARPESRQAAFPRTPGAPAAEGDAAPEIPADWAPEVGTAVRINSMGFEGIIRWIGEIEGKEGIFAGVELDRGFIGKGKNNGTFQG